MAVKKNKSEGATDWKSRSPQERLAEVERLRQERHGWEDGQEPRLQRLVRVIKLKDYD